MNGEKKVTSRDETCYSHAPSRPQHVSSSENPSRNAGLMSVWLPLRGPSTRLAHPLVFRQTLYEPAGAGALLELERRKFSSNASSSSLSAHARVPRLGNKRATDNTPSVHFESSRGLKTSSASFEEKSPSSTTSTTHSTSTSDTAASSPTSSSSSTPVPKKTSEVPQPFLTRTWAKVKHEANHYWDGSKLLASEIRISARLLRRLLKGKLLTRRERRQASSNFLCSLCEALN